MSLISIQNLSMSFQAGNEENLVLNDLSLSIERGKFVGLYGRSGSGKTTLLQIVGCLDQPTKGTYSFENLDVRTLDEDALTQLRRKRIGFIFQSFNLIPTMSVFENVEYPLHLINVHAKERRNLVDEVLAEVGLSEFANRFPAQLSGGQRQRVSIARALVKRPSLIIADEPTANLDDETSGRIAELLVGIQKNTSITILCSSHDHYFLENCDYKIKIQNGKVLRV